MNTTSLAFFAVARHSHSGDGFLGYLIFTLLVLLLLFMIADWLYETYFRYTDDPKRIRIITKHSALYEPSFYEILSKFFASAAVIGGIVGGLGWYAYVLFHYIGIWLS